MFIIGKANKKEIKEMKTFGWDVEKVNQDHFNKALDPKYDPKKNKDKNVEELIAVFVDNDMINVLREWHNEEVSAKASEKNRKLMEKREQLADDIFEKEKFDVEIVDHEGWDRDGDYFVKKFYYKNEGDACENGDSLTATFVIVFKKNSEQVVDFHINW
jgi:hypothetical protein